jgi:hypothetical protein
MFAFKVSGTMIYSAVAGSIVDQVRTAGDRTRRRRLNKLSCAGWIPHDRGSASGLPRSRDEHRSVDRLITGQEDSPPWSCLRQCTRLDLYAQFPPLPLQPPFSFLLNQFLPSLVLWSCGRRVASSKRSGKSTELLGPVSRTQSYAPSLRAGLAPGRSARFGGSIQGVAVKHWQPGNREPAGRCGRSPK